MTNKIILDYKKELMLQKMVYRFIRDCFDKCKNQYEDVLSFKNNINVSQMKKKKNVLSHTQRFTLLRLLLQELDSHHKLLLK